MVDKKVHILEYLKKCVFMKYFLDLVYILQTEIYVIENFYITFRNQILT